jgi:drug/metabolite transporter (DMT)-like permease
VIDAGSGIGASVAWGLADFLGGAASRRMAVLRVLLWAQLLGGSIASIAAFAAFGQPRLTWVLLGAIGGIGGGLGIIAFYSALRRAAMGIVAPISACGGVVPVLVALARGESPGTVALAGGIVALVGIVLVARGEHGPADASNLRFDTTALILSLLTVAGFGSALTMLDIAAGTGALNQSIWSSVGLRYGSLVVITASVIMTRTPVPLPPREHAWTIVGVGVWEIVANALFAIGAAYGSVVVVAIISATYPLVTASLARIIFGERLTAGQMRGASCIVAGAVLMSVPG